MRTTSSHGTFEQDIWKIAAVLITFLAVSCAGTGQKPVQKKVSPKTKIERSQETGAKKEVIRAEQKPLVVAATPKSRASVKMVEDGRKEMAAGNFDAAERRFQDAINIDPANGIAYYYLAKAKFELGQYVQANGVLDKAEGLLAGSDEWLEAVAALREMIKEKL